MVVSEWVGIWWWVGLLKFGAKQIPGNPENKPPIFEAHELLFGDFTQIEAHGLLKIHSSLLCSETVLTDFV